ncbi:MAG: hypothetical protein E7160_01320 [Firmicutes bacterium]|nr:hypothetical protein [Bacillota bacterium]
MNDYLIPANTKKGQLILGVFRKFDLILFTSGCLVTIVLLAFMPLTSTVTTILILMPAAICGFLVMPVPYYHNMLTVIAELYEYLTTPQTYTWKGWCYKDGKTKRK